MSSEYIENALRMVVSSGEPDTTELVSGTLNVFENWLVYFIHIYIYIYILKINIFLPLTNCVYVFSALKISWFIQ